MRRYTITVKDKAYEIDVEERNADSFRVVLDGRSIDVRVDDHQELSQALITPGVETPRLAGPLRPPSERQRNEEHSLAAPRTHDPIPRRAHRTHAGRGAERAGSAGAGGRQG